MFYFIFFFLRKVRKLEVTSPCNAPCMLIEITAKVTEGVSVSPFYSTSSIFAKLVLPC